jgi:hypothetical protein
MWALALKDALEQALKITCMWLKEDREPEVEIYTDFAIELESGDSMQRLIEMRKNRDLSQESLWAEAQRRGDLRREFDSEEEKKRLREEGPDPDTEMDLLAAAGRTVVENGDEPDQNEDDAIEERIAA